MNTKDALYPDLKLMCHELALAEVKRDFSDALVTDPTKLEHVQGRLDFLLTSYLQAYGYLVDQLDSDFVKELLERH